MNHLLLGAVSDIGAPGRSARAVWIRDGRIVEVGGEATIDRATAEGAAIHDYGHGYLVPGFVDPHVHLEVTAVANATTLDLRFPRMRTIADVLEALAQAVARESAGTWLLGQANLFWNRKLDDRRYPTRAELDAVSTEHPIAIRAGGHVSILNSLALRMAGIAEYEDQQGMMGRAVIERDEHGDLTGLIAELDALLPIPQLVGDALTNALAVGMRDLFTRRGVTTIGEISETREGGSALRALAASGRLGTRVRQYLWAPGAFRLDELDAELAAAESITDFEVAGVKVFADGGYSSRNAAVLIPYLRTEAGQAPYGDLNLQEQDVLGLLETCHRHHVQLIIHTNGERAQQMAMAALRVFEDRQGERLPGLLRLEHFGNLMTSADTLQQFLDSSAEGVTQPAFLYSFGEHVEELLGDDVLTHRHPYRRLIDAGVRLGASSDVHLGAEPEQTNPLFGVWAALSRESHTGRVLDPDQAITGRQALEMVTLEAARSLNSDSDFGSITPGKRADIVVLEADVTAVPIEQLRSVAVREVWRDGRIVHSAEDR
ncbi:amidohydrolase [Planosporangium flavigriseum]|uniref:Amidohydrolase 3 domain-containing protein n=1 Tax=Planosporangium flavigriseum TaxID=373681 RepID=A0A8J3PMU4_9ACTN|nr:amidohydrolase family protein [Planosporangium flavigriseum]GIG74674.1 hypothetical protein Pfl04_30780 [Planosporangium flavigriseum]